MRNGRYNTSSPMGFANATAALSSHLSPEAARNFTNLVKDVARQYSYNDSVMIRTLDSRLKSAARRRQGWAQEVLELLASDNKPQLVTT